VTSDDVVEALLTPELWADLLRSSASWKDFKYEDLRSPIDEAISVAIRCDTDDSGYAKKRKKLVILLLCRGGECVKAERKSGVGIARTGCGDCRKRS
jgi:hypothetical protein